MVRKNELYSLPRGAILCEPSTAFGAEIARYFVSGCTCEPPKAVWSLNGGEPGFHLCEADAQECSLQARGHVKYERMRGAVPLEDKHLS